MYEFSLPTKSDKVPVGSEWIHEIKYDGYRMLVVRDQDRVRLITRGGHDWADRFPLIVASALKIPETRFVIDGEVVVLRSDGVSEFDALASRKHDKRAMLYAFDLLAGDGEDLRTLPLALRKAGLAELLSDQVDGIFVAEYEQGEIGGVLFQVPVTWGSKALSRSDLIGPMAPAGANIGSRSRTPRIRRTAGSGTSSIGWYRDAFTQREERYTQPRQIAEPGRILCSQQ
jgi:bifunctional non-homologous end joining protein LigD